MTSAGAGKIIEFFSFYSERCLSIMESSLQFEQEQEVIQTNSKSNNYAKLGVIYIGGVAVTNLATTSNADKDDDDHFHFVSSDDDDETHRDVKKKDVVDGNSSSDESGNESGSSSDHEDDDHNDKTSNADQEIDNVTTKNKSIHQNEKIKTTRQPKKQKSNIIQLTNKQHEQIVRKHWETLPVVQFSMKQTVFEFEKNIKRCIELPSSLLPRELQHDGSSRCEQYHDLLLNAKSKTLDKKTSCSIIVLFLRSGRFAGGVFGIPKEEQSISSKRSSDCCIVHRTSVRYTVRKGQGKAQSSQDNQSRPKSMGAQLRRAGEINLQNDVAKTIVEWKHYFQQATYIFISVPKTMQKSLFNGVANLDNGGGTIKIDTILSKSDSRIRRVPLDLGRPSYESVCMIHSIMTTGVIREHDIIKKDDLSSTAPSGTTTTTIPDSISIKETLDEKVPTYPTFNPLHIAVQNGNIEEITSMIESSSDSVVEWKNQQAGEYMMTPLHIAADTTTSNSVDVTIAAECVILLLVNMKCNPCMLDGRNRVPYYLASHDKVREAFRISRGILGEDYCDWDTLARVGPSLTKDDIQLKKEKEADKKRKQRLRLKEKKKQEKIIADEIQQKHKEEQERIQQEVDAKRIRDGLQPKLKSMGGTIACDYCQTICSGKKRFDMYKRLEYSYCSTECVQKHKRELMANAALARFQ